MASAGVSPTEGPERPELRGVVDMKVKWQVVTEWQEDEKEGGKS